MQLSVAQGGSDDVEWGIDDLALGKTKYYDMISVQFIFKLPGGKHTFGVKSGGMSKTVKFKIGA